MASTIAASRAKPGLTRELSNLSVALRSPLFECLDSPARLPVDGSSDPEVK
jgi:hypothetical protein